MRTRVFTLAEACVFLSLTLPAHGQTSAGRSPGHPPNVSEAKDPSAILEIGASTSWNVTGRVDSLHNRKRGDRVWSRIRFFAIANTMCANYSPR